MKKTFAILVAAILLVCMLGLLASCDSTEENDGSVEEETSSPFYFMAHDDGKNCTVHVQLDQITGTSIEFPAKSPEGLTVSRFAINGDSDSITSITFPEGITKISDSFSRCTALETVKLPSTLVEIDSNVFKGCTALKSISLPSSLEKIGGGAFAGTGLTTVKLPDSVTAFSGAFDDCASLTSIHISKNATKYLSSFDLKNCPAISTITVSEDNPVYHAVNNCLIHTESKELRMACKTSQIPDDGSVTVIGSGAFSGLPMTTITIPEGITALKSSAFSDCTNLKTISLPSTLTTIDNGAFYGCTSLNNVTIPEGVTKIVSNAFTNCTALTKITIPASVREIGVGPNGTGGYDIFKGCTALQTVTYKGTVSSWRFACRYDNATTTYKVSCLDGTVTFN
ncbi:MAG: leucine-rich repeat domain-containing protein [Clostridia bacterium]|nr:leucine-rich repeat domain-containing protein [Clostridia bacterium]